MRIASEPADQAGDQKKEWGSVKDQGGKPTHRRDNRGQNGLYAKEKRAENDVRNVKIRGWPPDGTGRTMSQVKTRDRRLNSHAILHLENGERCEKEERHARARKEHGDLKHGRRKETWKIVLLYLFEH